MNQDRLAMDEIIIVVTRSMASVIGLYDLVLVFRVIASLHILYHFLDITLIQSTSKWMTVKII